MQKIRRALRQDWDKLLTDVLFIGFGIWSFVDQPASLKNTPEIFVSLLRVEFIIIGLILMVGTIIESYRVQMCGFVLYVIALVTMAGLVSVVGSSTVSLLILAFAVRGYTSIREMRTRKQFLCEMRQALGSPSEDQ